MDKAALERRLSRVAGFEDPSVELEQYPTPADLAAHLVHLADVQRDLAGKTVVDLGTGTGMLALGAAFRGPTRVLALDRDPAALAQARQNEREVAPDVPVSWLLADATRAPLCVSEDAPSREEATVLMNPPFGAQTGNEHADRAFLTTASEIASVSYSIHNAGSREFVEAFADDEGGEVTHAFSADLDVERQFAHQTSERAVIDTEVFRIRWE
ncbi:METTL5 family protein [Halorussus sp. MSC15.2]|uniref:METTL5 family protein n=1 Tax=Halorussus sp. MSC15.2 TaxID=2283638 RepID=UPI0013D7605F|nr:METTL5 family protein [Halorussus sp. MSC15.2]NEU56963.1 methyltransferase [Halorussus sp. MSC15.2]